MVPSVMSIQCSRQETQHSEPFSQAEGNVVYSRDTRPLGVHGLTLPVGAAKSSSASFGPYITKLAGLGIGCPISLLVDNNLCITFVALFSF